MCRKKQYFSYWVSSDSGRRPSYRLRRRWPCVLYILQQCFIFRPRKKSSLPASVISKAYIRIEQSIQIAMALTAFLNPHLVWFYYCLWNSPKMDIELVSSSYNTFFVIISYVFFTFLIIKKLAAHVHYINTSSSFLTFFQN